MRSSRAGAVRLVLLAALWHVPAEAHRGDWVYPIYEIPSSAVPELHDGTLSDWEDAVPSPSLVTSDFETLVGPVSPDNFAVQVYLSWNSRSQCIFVGIERVDDVIHNAYVEEARPTLYAVDGFAFFVDGDHSGGRYPDGSPDGGHAQAYYALAGTPVGDRLWSWGTDNRWILDAAYTDLGSGIIEGSPALVTTELKVSPWDVLDLLDRDASRRSELRAGGIVGFQVWLFDTDERSGEPEGAYIPIGSDTQYGGEYLLTADAFLDGELVPCDILDCESVRSSDSVVKEDSWGRIKASFR